MIGMHGRVSYTKAESLHECAFDIPLSRLLLETSKSRYVPSVVTKMLGRDAWNHSGLLPFVADAIAMKKTTKSRAVTALEIARASSENCARMYSRLVPTLFLPPTMTTTKTTMTPATTSLTTKGTFTVHLLRHAESEYNATKVEEENKMDPMIFDAALTLKGREQCRALHSKIINIAPTLIITSPLTRALETTLLAVCVAGDDAAAAEKGEEEEEKGEEEEEKGKEEQRKVAKPQIICWPELTERMSASCDIGIMKNDLIKKKNY